MNYLKQKKERFPEYLLDNSYFYRLNKFSGLLISKINVLEIFNMDDFL